jgi:hypothetical protein
MNLRKTRAKQAGYNLIETALFLPFLIALLLNAINFGYFYLMALNLSASSRSAVEYSITGQATPGTPQLPSLNNVVSTASSDIDMPSITSTFQLCSETVGVTLDANNAPVTSCKKGSGASFSSNGSAGEDPEAPHFVLQQVDVWYKFNPLIPGSMFSLVIPCSGGTCTFHRQALMRAMT